MMKMKSYVYIVVNLKAKALGAVVKTIGLLQKRCYNIKLETKKGEYERAIVNKCRPGCGDIKSITSLCKEALCKQKN